MLILSGGLPFSAEPAQPDISAVFLLTGAYKDLYFAKHKVH
jgi:hypothetical protein